MIKMYRSVVEVGARGIDGVMVVGEEVVVFVGGGCLLYELGLLVEGDDVAGV